jgi:hypothetical protein
MSLIFEAFFSIPMRHEATSCHTPLEVSDTASELGDSARSLVDGVADAGSEGVEVLAQFAVGPAKDTLD